MRTGRFISAALTLTLLCAQPLSVCAETVSGETMQGGVTVSGTVHVSGLTGADGEVLRLSGDTTLIMDDDLIVEKVESAGAGDVALTLEGNGMLRITAHGPGTERVRLTVIDSTVTAEQLSGFTQCGGIINLLGGPADSFRIYDGDLNVESDTDGLTGAFEIHGGNVYANAAGCGIGGGPDGGVPEIQGGTVTVRGGQRAVAEIPVRLGENVRVESPSSGYSRSGAAEYRFSESIRNLELITVYETGWMKDSTGWWYKRSDGSHPVSAWEHIGWNWYHFDERGYMQHGWLNDGGTWYYLGVPEDLDTGLMLFGTGMEIDGKYYVFDGSGVCLNP